MSVDEHIQRSRLATRMYQLWGADRVRADEWVIESASQAIARVERLAPATTHQLDAIERDDDA